MKKKMILILIFCLNCCYSSNYNYNNYNNNNERIYYNNSNGFNMYQVGLLQGSGLIPEIDSGFTTQEEKTKQNNENYSNIQQNNEEAYQNISQ